MRLLKYEFLKIWKNRGICVLILFLFLFNLAGVYQQTTQFDESRRCFPSDIKLAHQELAEIPLKDQVKWLEGEIQKAIDEGIWTTRIDAFRYILDCMKEVEQYDTYLASMKEQAILMGESSLFSEQNTFSKRNAAFIPEKYQHLEGLQLKYENSQGILLVTDAKVTDFCITIVLLLLGYCLICMEREEGTMSFQRCTKKGTKSMIRAKLVLVLLGSAGVTLLFYGINFVVAGMTYGFGDGNRWIQSVEGFITSPWKIEVWQFLCGFLLMKMFVMSIVALVIVIAALLGRSVLKTTLILIGVVAVEYGLYTWIPVHSWLDLFKKCNLFYLMRTEYFFKNYETINVGGYPVASWMLCGIFGMALFVVFILFSLASYERVSKSEYVQKTRTCRLRKKEANGEKHSLFYYEAYKFLWVHGALWILLGALGIQCMVYVNEVSYYSLEELYYKAYIKQLEGAVTEEKVNFVREEGIRLSNFKKPIEEQEAAYHRIVAQTERIGKDGIYMNEISYEKLLDKKEQFFNLGKLLLIFTLSFYPVFMIEKTSGMSSIWNSIPRGKEKIQRQKRILLIGYVFVTCILFESIFTACRMNTLEITSLLVPMSSLEACEYWKNISVLAYIGICCFIKICIGIICIKVIETISKKVKNESTVLLIAGSSFAIVYIFISIFYMRTVI